MTVQQTLICPWSMVDESSRVGSCLTAPGDGLQARMVQLASRTEQFDRADWPRLAYHGLVFHEDPEIEALVTALWAKPRRLRPQAHRAMCRE